jgi:hypothetical protein
MAVKSTMSKCGQSIRLERIIIEEENICFTETHQATRVVVNFYSAVVATQEAYLSTFY